eukprot:TRINITY_DN8215_c0_g1_i1.p1 TRINITY_DN8215_c0_g1~~TRINITY_DN8215_c0_g1_i1.p1  ORF type:complete len:114 (+),score=33.60 TRINITY_DN8215_c0_g1_i1:15-356(+)
MSDDTHDPEEVVQEGAKTAEQKKEQSALGNLSSQVEASMDNEKAKNAITKLSQTNKAIDEAQAARAKQLAAVQVNPADVDYIANELEISKKAADLAIREHNGNAVSALVSLLH